MNEAFLLVGGNMGNRKQHLSKAMEAIEKNCGNILARSSIYQTAAWGKEDQQDFLNQVLKINTILSAPELLKKILLIEEAMGRKREIKYGPRLIDIDILFFNDEIIHIAGLTIPHEQLQFRRFALVPFAEIAGEKIHPLLHQSINQLLASCADPLNVNKFNG